MKNEIYSKVFLWLFIGLAVTFGTGYFLSFNQTVVENLLTGGSFWIIVLLELGIAIYLGVRIQKMSQLTAIICYLVYAFTTGFTFALLFMAYELTSMISVFAITAFVFLMFSLYGFFTKKDLSKIGTFLMMGILGILIASIIGIFIQNSMYFVVLNVIGIVLFIGYIAYDIKMIERLTQQIGEDKVAIYGAFQLYLDFINLFIRLLELFGKQKD